MASASQDGTVKLWAVTRGVVLQTLTDHSGPVLSVAFNPQNDYLASGSEDGDTIVWSVKSIVEGHIDHQIKTTLTHTQHTGAVWCLDFSPNGQYLASGGADRTIWVWDFKEDQIYRLAAEHGDAVTAVAFNPDKTMLVTGSLDRRIKLVMNF